MAVLQANRLFIETRVPDDRGGNLSIIRLDDANPIFGEVLIPQVEGVSIHHPLDHRRIQQAQPVSRTWNLISHTGGTHGEQGSPNLNVVPSVKRKAKTVKHCSVIHWCVTTLSRMSCNGYVGNARKYSLNSSEVPHGHPEESARRNRQFSVR